MDKAIQQQLLDKSSQFMTEAAKTLGQTASHVYTVLVRQQFVEGLSSLISIGLFGLIYGIAAFMYINFCKKHWSGNPRGDNSDRQFGMVFEGFIIAVIFGLLLATAASHIGLAVQKLINPEYFAIQFIFNAVKK